MSVGRLNGVPKRPFWTPSGQSLTTEEAAKMLGLDASALTEKLQQREFPMVSNDGQLQVSLSTVKALLNKGA